MGELTIRTDRRLPSVRGQGTARGQKTAGGAAGQGAARTAFPAAETLEQLIRTDSRAAVRQAREAFRTLQSGESALNELQDSLERLGELARRAAEGGDADREALQGEAERLLKDVERILSAEIPLLPESGGEAGAGDRLAVLLLGAVIAGDGALPEELDPEQALEGLKLLLEKVAGGADPDQAVAELTGGRFTGLADFRAWFSGGEAPEMPALPDGLLIPDGLFPALPDLAALLPLLELGGTDRGLMAQVLTALERVKSGPESVRTAPEGAEAAAGGARGAPGPVTVTRAGGFEAAGRDLSGLSFRAEDGGLTVGGAEDVTLRGTEQRAGAITVAGSGTVTLREVEALSLTAAAPQVRLFAAGETAVGELRLAEGTVLTADGTGPLRVGALRAEKGSLLRLAAGAAVMPGRGERLIDLTAPAVLEGPASLAAAARAGARGPDGRALEPFDVVWDTLLPGWSSITAAAVDGKQARMALLRGDPVRLWLSRGDHGYDVHDLVLQGRDETGRPQTRYAYLIWNRKKGAFEEASLEINPFSVTGGEPGLDWIYEEEKRTLRILSGRVTAVSGGSVGESAPLGGRIALADGIGRVSLTLEGVACRTAAGSALDLGRDNDVTLLLPDGTDSRFESGPGRAGISLGEGTVLRLDRAAPGEGGRGTDGTLTAIGGRGGAGIGRDGGGSRDRTSRVLILGGKVTGAGGASAAGIGAGRRSAIGTITIAGGTVFVTGGSGGGAGIGGALDAPAGDIRISGGRITARAAGRAAAIGSGVQGACGDIWITGTARILEAAAIGACPLGGCGRVTVDGGADIGAARITTQADVPEERDGETSPRFLLTVEGLGLDRLRVRTREEAQRAVPAAAGALRRLAALRRIYGEMYARAARGGVPWPEAGETVRDPGAAGELLDDLKRSAPQAVRAHGRPGEAGALLKG